MIAARRTRSNFGLQRAVELAEGLGKPLLVFEPLAAAYPWASERFSRFIAAGMQDNAFACARHGVGYFPYLEPHRGAGRGLLEALAAQAAAVVTDEFPTGFLPRLVAAAAQRLDVQLERVDGNGLLPLRAAEREFPTAYAFRRHLQRTLPSHIADWPAAEPLSGLTPAIAVQVDAAVRQRWPPALLSDVASPSAGGSIAGSAAAEHFVEHKLDRYVERRNHPDYDATSGLSPYLHFGHVSVHDVVGRVLERSEWDPGRLGLRPTGRRTGWWRLDENSEAFLDQIVTWRELGYGFCFHRSDHDRFEALPTWAQTTLEDHELDPRPVTYSNEQLECAATHDPLWNAAQTQLLREGQMHNYLRMLWGKKILEWSRTPRQALERMLELNNRWALDGRDPNSISGILWVLGGFDRAWGPERLIYGKIRYMTSANAARKLRLRSYVARYQPVTPEELTS